MNLEKLFQAIWRINAILILLAGGGVLFLVAGQALDAFEPQQVTNLATVAPDVSTQTVRQIGTFAALHQTNQIAAPLEFQQRYSLESTGYKEGTGVSNYLFYDLAAKSSRWLLPTNDYVILSFTPLPKADRQEPVRWVQYTLVKADTNKNEQLSETDQITLAISQSNGTNYRELISEIDRLLGTEFRSPETLIVFYQSQNSSYVSTINLAELKVVSTTKLPEIAPETP